VSLEITGTFWLEPACHANRDFPVFRQLALQWFNQRCGHFMEKEFKDVARQLEETTAKLNNTRNAKARYKLLALMRRLLAEADRLLSDDEAASDAA
jgi:hypothetical protein